MTQKFLSYIFPLLFPCVVFSQNIPDAVQMPIYPTCYKIKDNKERLACFQTNITSIYTKQLEKYINSFEYLNLPESEAKIILELTKEGEFNLKEIKSNSSLFKGYNQLAFDDFKQFLIENKIKITPAKTIDGEKEVGMLVSFPIDFKLNRLVDEKENARLISVLEDKEASYKIFITPDKELKVYQVNDLKPIYLGTFKTIQELKETLPYQSIIADSGELITLAQADFGKTQVLLQTLNIFNEKDFYTLFIVSEVKGKKIKQLRKYTTLEEFKKSAYYDWLIQ